MAAKRFTDTGKWKRPWFGELSAQNKLFWIYILDQCDHAGIWPANWKLAQFELGFELNEAQILNDFSGKIIKVDHDKLCVKSFYEFQYGGKSAEFRAKSSAKKILQNFGVIDENENWIDRVGDVSHLLFSERNKDLPKCPEVLPKTPSIGIGIGISNKGECEGKPNSTQSFENRFKFNFKALFAEFPNPRKKAASLALMAQKIQSEADYVRLKAAISNYRDDCEKEERELKFILQCPSFMNEWEDWVERKVDKPGQWSEDSLKTIFKPRGAS